LAHQGDRLQKGGTDTAANSAQGRDFNIQDPPSLLELMWVCHKDQRLWDTDFLGNPHEGLREHPDECTLGG
jgi:hypothetical protein